MQSAPLALLIRQGAEVLAAGAAHGGATVAGLLFLHERGAEYPELLHVPEWIWPLLNAPVVLQRLHEVAVDLVDHACNPAYHRARRAGRCCAIATVRAIP